MAAEAALKRRSLVNRADRTAFMDAFVQAVNRAEWYDGRAQHRNFSFGWRIGESLHYFDIRVGRVAEHQAQPGIEKSWDFTIAAPAEIWEAFLEPLPRAPYHHLFGLWARVPSFSLDGRRETLVQNATYINALLRLARATWNAGATAVEAPHIPAPSGTSRECIRASFVHMRLGGEACRLYVEEAGEGPELLLLHTAGSDSRQFYHLFNDERLTSRWRLVAFDLPGHGKSLPPAAWLTREYRLSNATYVEQVLSFVEQMGMRRPVILGCSMAGALCLSLAHDHPEKFAGVIACEAADRVPGRLHHWLRHPRVDSAEFGPEWIDGLISPYCPDVYRQEILWQYAQAGAGVFFGDVAFYSGEFRLCNPGAIDTNKCPVYMLTGEYDYSCTPEMSRKTAESIPGARFQEMKRIGHFPMAENPEGFMEYLMPILEELRQGAAAPRK